MSEQQTPFEPGQPVADPSLTPPPDATMGQPGPWTPAPPPAPAPLWNRIAAYVVLLAVVAAAAGAGIGWSLARAVNPGTVHNSTAPEAPIAAASPNPTPSSGSTSLDAIAARVDPALVDVNTTIGTGSAAGTGMIISSTGEILTNNHVVAQSSSITVTVQGRGAYPAHVVGVDISQDVAVIQIDHAISGLPTVKFADSSTLNVGDTVYAIGNALGEGGTPHASQGQVTDLNQTITASEGGGSAETLNGMIESDALIYEGDSGGALLNTSGQVVGMITAGQAQGFRSSASSVGYAIASNTALGVVNRIRAHEQSADLTYTQVGYLGVQVQTLDAASAAQLGLNASSGALVVAVVSGSPAASAGMTRYSVITSLGGMPVTSTGTLGAAIKAHQPGERVSVTWITSSGSHTATVTLAGINP